MLESRVLKIERLFDITGIHQRPVKKLLLEPDLYFQRKQDFSCVHMFMFISITHLGNNIRLYHWLMSSGHARTSYLSVSIFI